MKRLLIIIQIFIFSLSTGFAQIQYEGQQDAALKVFQSEDGTLKFYKVDKKKGELLVFNEDNSLWKSIALKTPKGHLIDDINIIDVSMMDDKNELKILFTCYYKGTYTMEDLSEHFSKQVFMLNIIDEEGNFLLQIPEAMDYKLLTANGKNKLLVYKTDKKGFKSRRRMDIYSF